MDTIAGVYLTSALAWMAIIYKIARPFDPISLIILTMPLITFLVNWQYSKMLEDDPSDNSASSSTLSIGILITIPLLNWTNREWRPEHRKTFVNASTLAIILALLSSADTYAPREKMVFMKHVKSSLQGMALFLLIYVLYTFYFYSQDNMFANPAVTGPSPMSR